PKLFILHKKERKKYVMFIDDLIRFNLDKSFGLFEYENIEAYTIKITRDAELDLDDDVSKGFYDRMKKSLKQRTTGQPVRFIYDQNMPKDILKYLTKKLSITEDDNLIAGGRYHNSKDFMKFPHLDASLEWGKLVQTDHVHFSKSRSILTAIDKNDILLNYPYQH